MISFSNVSIRVIFFYMCVMMSHAGVVAGGEPDSLLGIWGTEQIIVPMIGGELTIDARTPIWSAAIDGHEVAVQRVKDSVKFVLTGSAGEFRGRYDKMQRKIVGHWIQPGSIGPYYQAYASPVQLSEASPNVWKGNVAPLEHRISFYISIRKESNGNLSAFIRNPEANYFAGRNYNVAMKRDSVFFDHPNIPEAGIYDKETGRLLLPLLNSYPPLIFTRRTQYDAVGFYPRVFLHDEQYVYRQPVAESDGWTTGSLSETDIDKQAIEAFVQKIITAVPSPDNPLNIHSLLIARHGKLVLEEYFYGFQKNRTHDMRSASKTIAPVLVGIARDKGVNIDSGTRVYPLFSNYSSFENWDARKSKIRVEDLMNMASGLAIDDSDPDSPGGEGRMQDQNEQPDWCKYTLDLPMIREPGGSPIYGSANTNLVGAAVRNAAGVWLPALFDEYFARPLQISTYHMNLMPTGEAYAGGGLYMRPRDQLKLGQLYLNGGEWNGHRVVSKEWVKRSLVSHGIMKPRMDIDLNHGYGYAWHFRNCEIGGRKFEYYWAGGNGGQLIIVIPALDMVVGFTGGDYAQFRKYLRWEIELLPQFLIPAVLK